MQELNEVTLKIAIIDYQSGNLFSVAQACRLMGVEPFLTHDPEEVRTADGILLPGVGAFDEPDLVR